MQSAETNLIDRIQENFVTYFRLFADLPGITFVEEDVTWLVNTNKSEPGNHILRTRLAADDLDRQIEGVFQRIGALTDHIDWLVFPGCRPQNLEQQLTARGITGHVAGTWMTASVSSLPHPTQALEDFTVRQVHDDASLAVWTEASAAGFGEDVQLYHDAYSRHGYGPDTRSLHYIGYQGDEPVTSATLLLSEGIAGLYDISTPPALRRRGYGSAITAYTMNEARRLGYDTAWLWASNLGQGMYSLLGFVETDFGVREYSWSALAAH